MQYIYLKFFVCEIFPQLSCYPPEIGEGNLTSVIVVKKFKSLEDLLLGVLLRHLVAHQHHEAVQTQLTAALLVHLCDHLLDLLLPWLKAQRAHRHLQLLGVDGARAVRVEEVERLANLLLLLLLRRAPRVVKAWRQRSRARGSRRTPIAVGAQTVAGTRGPGRSGRGTPRRTVSSNFFDFCFFDILPVETGSSGASFMALYYSLQIPGENKKNRGKKC